MGLHATVRFGSPVPPYPASISGRKLLDQHGQLIQLRTVSSWGLAQLLSNTWMTQRLEETVANGFNSWTVVADGANSYGTGWSRYNNANSGLAFYTGTPYQSSLGSAWATHITHLMNEAQRLGMFMCLSLYSGAGTDGSQAEMVAASDAQCRTTGQNWATFLASWPNWILHVGADSNWTVGSTIGSRVNAFCQGIKDLRPSTIIIAECNTGTTAHDQWAPGDFTYFTPIECIYNRATESAVEAFDTVYTGDPSSGPVWDCEPVYVGGGGTYTGMGNPPTAAYWQEFREKTYATYIRGGIGINNGHADWWHDPYHTSSAGNYSWSQESNGTYMTCRAFVEHGYAVPILNLTNTVDWAPVSTFVTTGLGTGDTKAAQGSDGLTAVAYFPDSRTIAVDTTIMTGTGNVRLRWFDPTAGTYPTTIAASEAQQSGRSITYPSAHSDSSNDWVLVVDLA